MNQLTTTHKLDFESRKYSDEWNEYKVGTVKGLWRSDEDNLIILSFINHEKGNGHLDDVFEWFEFS